MPPIIQMRNICSEKVNKFRGLGASARWLRSSQVPFPWHHVASYVLSDWFPRHLWTEGKVTCGWLHKIGLPLKCQMQINFSFSKIGSDQVTTVQGQGGVVSCPDSGSDSDHELAKSGRIFSLYYKLLGIYLIPLAKNRSGPWTNPSEILLLYYPLWVFFSVSNLDNRDETASWTFLLPSLSSNGEFSQVLPDGLEH